MLIKNRVFAKFALLLYMLPLLYVSVHTVIHHSHGHLSATSREEISVVGDYCPVCDYSPVTPDVPHTVSLSFYEEHFTPYILPSFSHVVPQNFFGNLFLRAPPHAGLHGYGIA